ncbi:MAG: TlpA family protein disulfide reductase [Mangrovibacterium sp.]
MNRVRVFLYLCVFSVGALLSACGNQSEQSNDGLAKVNGKWMRKWDKKIEFFEIVDGRTKPLAASSIQEDGSFGLAVPIKKEGFYTVGAEDVKGRMQFNRHQFIFYFKPGDQLNIEVNDSTYYLVGKNTKENLEIERWHKVMNTLDKVYFKPFHGSKLQSTYVDFFPKVMEVDKEVKAYKEKKTKNPIFDIEFPDMRKIDYAYMIMLFHFQPRMAHAQAEDYPQPYHEIDVKDLTKTTKLLKYPLGAVMINHLMMMHQTLNNQKFNPEAYKELLQNDTIIGEYLIQDLRRQTSYSTFLNFYDKNKKYFLSADQKKRIEEKRAYLQENSSEGSPIVDFTYPDVNGKMHSISDFKGKLVYIDCWATWCSPCKQQLPHLAKIEEEYQGKNIAFVAVSFDNDKDIEKWKSFVKDNKLGGVQLHAKGAFQSDLAKAYGINAIPRFLLVGKDGNVISTNAPRPSSADELKKLINAHL